MSHTFPEYAKRRAEFVGVRTSGPWSVKLYTIDTGRGDPAGASLPAAEARIPELLPEVGDNVHGEAFAIVHAGEDAVWLLVHWWTDTCLMHHRMVSADLRTPERFDRDVPDTLIACSWELAVVQHERDAWVRTVQGRGANADYAAYRSDVLPPTDV